MAELNIRGTQLGNNLQDLLNAPDIQPGDNRFYVYVLFRPWNGEPFYVGKGQRNRYLHHHRSGENHNNIQMARIFKKAERIGLEVPVVIVRSGITEDVAFEIEIALIAAIGRDNMKKGPLVNLTDGGDGQSGWIPPQETRDKIRKSNTGKKMSPEARAKMSLAGKGRKKTPEHKAKISAGNMGKTMSVCARTKMRIGSMRRWSNPEQRAKVAAFHASMSPEEKEARRQHISETTRSAMARMKVNG